MNEDRRLSNDIDRFLDSESEEDTMVECSVCGEEVSGDEIAAECDCQNPYQPECDRCVRERIDKEYES